MFSNSVNRAKIVAVTGAGGRLGGYLLPGLRKAGLDCIAVPRSALSSPAKMKEFFEEHKPFAVINAAVASQGSLAEMMNVNVKTAVELGMAAEKTGSVFIHISTNATEIPGINSEQTPYAWSKLRCKQELLQVCKPFLFNLDVLIDSNQPSQLDISSLVVGGLPMSVRINGAGRQLIQPTSYLAASQTITNAVKELVEGHSIPSTITVAGHAIKFDDFIDLSKSHGPRFKERGFALHIDPKDLFALAGIVRNGSLSPEFLHLNEMSLTSPKTHCIQNFIRYHKDPIPTHEELAKHMGNAKALTSIKTLGTIFRNSDQKFQFTAEALKILNRCEIKPYKLT